jgi:hypothetical protein
MASRVAASTGFRGVANQPTRLIVVAGVQVHRGPRRQLANDLSWPSVKRPARSLREASLRRFRRASAGPAKRTIRGTNGKLRWRAERRRFVVVFWRARASALVLGRLVRRV